jgi:hypothetical protein
MTLHGHAHLSCDAKEACRSALEQAQRNMKLAHVHVHIHNIFVSFHGLGDGLHVSGKLMCTTNDTTIVPCVLHLQDQHRRCKKTKRFARARG